jgi:aryl-alcohol dehydrogenase-like predicted oxidoreductase
MKRRPLGRTGLSVSEIGFGCGPTAALMIRDDVKARREAVAHALSRGINYFDTAPVYGDGLSERHLGAALRELGAKPIVATKVALHFEELGDIPGAVTRSVEASIERLGIKPLPLVHLHNRVGTARAPRPDIGSGALVTVDDVLGRDGVAATFRVLRARGLIDQIGCCAFGGEMRCVEQLIDSGEFATLLVHYSLLNRTALASGMETAARGYAEIGAKAAAAGMGLIALRVLEAGALVDGNKHSALAQLADAEEQPLAAFALRFALTSPSIATALVGFSSINHIDAAVDAMAHGPLPTELVARIEALQS